MEIFPFSIIRVCGGDFDSFEQINLNETNSLINNFVNFKEDYKKSIDSLCEDLFKAVSLANTKEERHELINIKRDVFNRRTISNNRIRYLKKNSYLNKRDSLETYLNIKSKYKNLHQEIVKSYRKELNSIQNEFKKISNQDFIKKGILLSSSEFYTLGESKYWGTNDKNNNTYNSIENGLAKYLSRIYTKTSPFSTFTSIIFCRHNKNFQHLLESDFQVNHVSKVYLNNYLFKYLKILMSDVPLFMNKFNIYLNKSISIEDNYISFFIHYGKTESIQRIKENNITKLLFYFFKNKEVPTFEDLVNFIFDKTDSPKRDIRRLLKRLINIGLIEYGINRIEGIDIDWNKKLIRWIKNLPKNDTTNKLISTLSYLQNSLIRFQTFDSKKRAEVLFESYSKFKEICQKLRELSEFEVDDKTGDKSQAFYEINPSKEFNFNPDDLFYEDSVSESIISFNNTDIESTIGCLNVVLKALVPYEQDFLNKNELADFFLEEFGPNKKINLLNFYETYFRNRKEKKDYFITPNKLSDRIFPDNNFLKKDRFSISLEKIKDLAYNTSDVKHRIDKQGSSSSHSVFLQLLKENSNVKAVINNLYPGFGKMFSRFLNNSSLTEATILHEIRSNNLSSMGKGLWAENRDSTYFNANIHPSLMPFEITFPGSNNTLKENFQISINNLVIKYDAKKHKLILVEENSNKQVSIYDLCFEAKEWRSELFQLLYLFSPVIHHNLDTLLIRKTIRVQKILNQQRDNNDFDILKVPRIDIANKLIIQRKTWFVPKKLLPNKKKNEDEVSYLIKVNEWRIKNKIPKEVYINLLFPAEMYQLDEKLRNQFSRDSLKPQYISFANPYLVRIFSDICSKVPRVLKISEMLPKKDDLLSINDGKRVTEFFYQWKS